jgi:site-specific DNA-methyltransferase (adenine-specific)
MILGAFNTLAQAESLKSYLSTRLIQFIINASLIGANLTNKESWRFVPDPGTFDHIFTDEELYKKYNLTDEEINIIESVIKERK